MIDFTKPVQTRDGRPVEIITTKGRGQYPILYYIDDCLEIYRASTNGREAYCNNQSPYDLINVPEPRVYFANLTGYGAEWITKHGRAGATHKITITGEDCRIEAIK